MIRKKFNQGFTLIELLIVISIIITILALTVPAVIGYQRKQAESEEVKNFVSSFKSTQNLALTTDSTYSLSFQDGEVLFCPANSEDCKKISNDYLRSSVQIIYVDRYGNLVNQGNTIITQKEITLSTPSFNVIINKFGRIYVQNRQ